MQYDYVRQAVLYSDLLGAACFIFVGMQQPRIKQLKSTPEVCQFGVLPAPAFHEPVKICG